MSQALDPTGRVLHKMSHSGAMSAGSEPTEARYVCPFCGNVNENREGACPRCSMENTPLTRQATRARIGPWSVLQTRNPSAPGMKYSTLLSLVKKAQVTPRSIVRGPTTHQLWRFASKVKGLSREFGLCWGCGQEIEHTASVCPHCQRSQEPPAAPDALVEGRTPVAASLPVRREIRPEFKNPAQLAETPRQDVRPVIEPMRAEVPRREILPVIESPLVAGIVPEQAIPIPQTATERRAALEAAAMREGGLPFPAPARGRLERSRMGRAMVVVITMVVIMVGGWLFVDETSRSVVAQWLHINTEPKNGPGANLETVDLSPAQQPPRSHGTSFSDVRVPSVAPRTPVNATPAPAPATPRTGNSTATGSQGTPAPTPQVQPSAPQPEAVAGSDKPEFQSDIDKSRSLWKSALDAEMRNQPAEALGYLEQIRLLPPAAWQGGLDLHVKANKDKLAAQGR